MFFDKIRTFCKIVEGGGNFAAAANLLNLSRSGVSKQVQSLEQDLGFTLFQGTRGSHTLTPEGKVFYPAAQKILAEYHDVVRRMSDVASNIQGKLKVGTTNSIASQWMVDYLKELLRIHPDLNLDVVGADIFQDSLPNDIDILIWPGKLRSSLGLTYLPLVQFQLGLFASETYLKKFGVPHSVKDLHNHKLIGFGENVQKPFGDINWHLESTTENLKPFFSINSVNGILKSVEQGLGIGSLSQFEVSMSQHSLIEILPSIEKPKLELYFVVASGREKTERIVTLYDYFKHVLENHQLYLAA